MTKSPIGNSLPVESVDLHAGRSHRGLLFINADDWGRDRETTDRISDCLVKGVVTSVSAMVFMEDSARSAVLARESGIDAGLHLNFTTRFSARDCPPRLAEHQERVATYLLRNPLARAVFQPFLSRSFEYVVKVQIDEFARYYGENPQRLDGHHHMHLCANVLLSGFLPRGSRVRRNFSFQPGQKSFANRMYRKTVDAILARRHRLTDFFFSLPPLDPTCRLERIFDLAREYTVEVETHPVRPEEYAFLTGSVMQRITKNVPMSR